MIILEAPYASDVLLDWCAESQHPVLGNAFVRSIAGERTLNLVDETEAIRRLTAGERVYTNSENALAWIAEHAPDAPVNAPVALFKDKAATRRALAELDPQLFFRKCSVDELRALDFDTLPVPFVLKPSVGFCSMGVHVVSSRADWEVALADIAENASVWQQRYPESVVGVNEFVLEGYLDGQEYALDAYYDEDGAPHLVNVLRHDFASSEDTSDRMYVTSPSIIEETAPMFLAWLARVNEVVGARNFPMHVEVRVKDGHVSPIEFNPLRFAGLSGTDIAWYAYGYRTYQAFLDGEAPSFPRIFESRRGKTYCMSLLGVPDGCSGYEPFDLAGLMAHFSHPLRVLEFDGAKTGSYAFVFLETNEETAGELDYLLHVDLREFVG
ncbi:ATP-grasp domain-containing protein [Adlercreutzia sp. ZJ138]|uniref:ATP-grasp domain-containing protein n=1 Tax=Adlercreutzia sp. ZJ138 TaxID=2709405 RepID=UPI0013EBC89C|nr:ATP-grasp domain-containing protein [Adlercreutzia sp. ZJ138]